MSIKIENKNTETEYTLNDLNVGDVVQGSIVDNDRVKPGLFLRTFSGLVSLDNPGDTWTWGDRAQYKKTLVHGHKVNITITVDRPKAESKSTPRPPIGYSPELFREAQGGDWYMNMDREAYGRSQAEFLCDGVVAQHTPGTNDETFKRNIRLVAYDEPGPGRVEVADSPDDGYRMTVAGRSRDTFVAFDDWFEDLGRGTKPVWLDLEVL